jgi:hypothetical protein
MGMPAPSVAIGPLPTELASVNWAFARALASARCLVDRAVHQGVVEVEADGSLVGGHHGLGQGIEDPRCDPLVASGAQGRVRDPADQALGVDPAAPGDQADQHGPQADPIRNPGPMTTQRMGGLGFGEQGLDGGKHGIKHFGLERAHDGGDLHCVVGDGSHPTSQLGHHGDRWMVSIGPYPRGL